MHSPISSLPESLSSLKSNNQLLYMNVLFGWTYSGVAVLHADVAGALLLCQKHSGYEVEGTLLHARPET